MVVGAALGVLAGTKHVEETCYGHVGPSAGEGGSRIGARVLQQGDGDRLDLLRRRVSLGVAASKVGQVQMHGGAVAEAGI